MTLQGPPHLRKRLLFVSLLGLAVFVALLAWGDFRGVAGALAGFSWGLLPIALGLVLFNYSVRFLKWQYFLHVIGVRDLPVRSSLLVFLAGLGMTITPGKVGEWLKSYFLLTRHGIPVAQTAPIVLAERLTDGFGLILLASAGLLLVREGWLLLAVLAVMGLAFVAALRHRPFGRWAIAKAARLPVLRKYAAFMGDFYEHSASLLSPKPLIIGTALGAISWSGEGLALYAVYLGLGAPNTWQLALEGIFVLAITTLAGLAALVPGGLGVTEGGIAGLSQTLAGLSRDGAAAATLIIRLCTLWFGVAIGSIAVLVATRGVRGDDARG